MRLRTRGYDGAQEVGTMKGLGLKVAVLAGLVVLSACGGGGDNAGVCSGSDEVCGRPGGSTTSTTGSTQLTPSTPVTTVTTSTTPTNSSPPTTTTFGAQ